MTPWVEPTTLWSGEEAEHDHRLEALRSNGELLITWPSVGIEREPTYCYRLGPQYLVWQPEFGGATFTREEPSLSLHPLRDADRSFFWTLVSRSWLPAIYPLWKRQVLHASAVADGDGVTVGFSGPSGAGKSTIAYALGRRPGWSMIADDTIAFSCSDTSPTPVRLHPLRLQSRLRDDTARYFGAPSAREEAFTWPAVTPALTALFILDGAVEHATVDIAPQSLSASYGDLLRQAHALSLNDAELNRQLMGDYATLATTISVFRLTYPKTFERLDTVLDQLEALVRELKQRRASRGESQPVAAGARPGSSS